MNKEKITQIEINPLSIYNKDGTTLNKEEFLKLAEEQYDIAIEKVTNVCEPLKSLEDLSYVSIITDPECHVDIETTLDSFDFYRRSVFITDEIEQTKANSIFDLIRFWNYADETDDIPIEERDPIKIYINTPGGDMNAVFTIIGAITTSQTPIHTITIGQGYSGGFFIGVSGHKRYGLPYSSYLFHEGEAADSGDAHKIIQRIEFYERQLEILKLIVLKNTKITEKEYYQHKTDDWYLDVNDALKYGIIDEIIENI